MNIIKSVLLIDNNEIDNYVNKRLLEECGVLYITAYNNAITALIHLREEPRRYDLIFVAIYLPVFDAFEFIDAYNKSGLQNKHGKICLLSSTINPDHKLQAINKNALFMEKPLTNNKIENLMIDHNS